MDDEMTVNLTASLLGNATDLSGVANHLAGLSTDQEIEYHAKILDCIAEDASQGADILRAMIARRKRARGLLPGRVSGDRDSAIARRVPRGTGSAP
jgi:hypothetical protein